ncbi:hypothetical protein LTR60_003722 [Cryomyces antarcticus]|nr:hypothetical protein LTR39_003739 [Cryomyces antarcticus]KAK5013711.1 hypothetical protein LTR60_003722 [Cryomyces antarcticus]
MLHSDPSAGVHAILASHAGSDNAHWAKVNPSYGFCPTWLIKRTAMVVDAMDVLRMLVQDRLAFLLKNTDAITSLVRLYNQVKQHGICVVSYAEWFLEDHPEWTKPVAFDQEQAETFSVIGELAVMASIFYKSTAAFAHPPSMMQFNRWTVPKLRLFGPL